MVTYKIQTGAEPVTVLLSRRNRGFGRPSTANQERGSDFNRKRNIIIASQKCFEYGTFKAILQASQIPALRDALYA
jgi:hypothetical protein